MTKMYCYKFKHGILKIRGKEYAHARIEEFGFKPIFSDFEEDLGGERVIHHEWEKGWGKTVLAKYNSPVGMWIKNNIESIYKQEKDKEDSKWIKSILESGYEFDENGKIIENDIVRKDIECQLCVMLDYHELSGCLFLNVGGTLEFYDTETLDKSVPEEIIRLIGQDVIYKKRLKV